MPTGVTPENARRLRRAVFARDFFRCRDCGRQFVRPRDWKGEGIEGLTLGHVIPKAMGGTWTVLNLIAQCLECNAELGNNIWVAMRHPNGRPAAERRTR